MLLKTVYLVGLSTFNVIIALFSFSKVFGVIGSLVYLRMALS